MASRPEHFGVEGLDLRGRDVASGDVVLALQPVGCHLCLAGTVVQEGHSDLPHVPVFGHQATAAQQAEDGPPHVPAGERVDDGVEQGVDDGHPQEVVGLEEHGAFTARAAEVR